MYQADAQINNWEEYFFGKIRSREYSDNNVASSLNEFADRRRAPSWFAQVTTASFPVGYYPPDPYQTWVTPGAPASKPYTNTMRATPKISCNERSIGIQVETMNPYMGRLFVSNHAENKHCAKKFFAESNVGQLDVPIGACDMKTTRFFSPRSGIEYSATVVASFHPEFLTEEDRLYHLKCSYYQSAASIGSFYEVSVFPTEILTSQFALPDCKYTLHTQTVDGPQAEFAKIGDKVFHRWQCDTEFYSIKVKSCYVDDGKRRRYQLIDSHGCAHDPVILPNVIYDKKTALAYAPSHVFKFADSGKVFFHCQVLLCFKGETGCGALSPPDCSPMAIQLRHKRALKDNGTTANMLAKEETSELEIASAELTVLELGDEPKLESYVNRMKLSQCSFCVTQLGFATLIVCNLVTLIVATATSIALCRKHSSTIEAAWKA
uniref:ZP domain-containing protein n=1 Tax=Plectus sambesii TaxID=2011161 RepID=A0A914WHI4_9BILA